jgi:hypothetical protein
MARTQQGEESALDATSLAPTNERAVQRSGYSRQLISVAIDHAEIEAYRDHGKLVISRASFAGWLKQHRREMDEGE